MGESKDVVAALTEAVTPRRTGTVEQADRLVAQILDARYFAGDVAMYADAIFDVLSRPESISRSEPDEQSLRDILRRVLDGLLASRPWLPRPFRFAASGELERWALVPVVGHLIHPWRLIEAYLNHPFALRSGTRVLGLHLTDGPSVFFTADESDPAQRTWLRVLDGPPGAAVDMVCARTGLRGAGIVLH